MRLWLVLAVINYASSGLAKAVVVEIRLSKILDVKDVITFVRLLGALRFRALRLCFTAIFLALIEIISIVILAVFVSSTLIGEPQEGVLDQVIAHTGFYELEFLFQSLVCLLLFLGRFLLGLILANFIFLQSNQLQLKLRNILFSVGLKRGVRAAGGVDLSSGATADLVVRQVNLIGKGIVEPALRVLGELFILLLILISIFVVSPLILAFMVATISPLVLFYIFKFKRITRVHGQVANSELQELSAYATSFTFGWRQLGVPMLRDSAAKILDASARKFATADRLASLIGFAPRYFLELFMVIFLIFAVLLTNASSSVGSGDLVFIGGAGARLLPIISSVSNALISFQFNRAVLGNVTSQICTRDLVTNLTFAVPVSSTLSTAQPNILKTLELNAVGHGYKKERALFEDVSLSLTKGDFVLIKGKSGVGKTTLMDIMCGIRAPKSGQVLVNGLAIDKQQWFAEKVFYSPQQPLIIPGSILENILFSEASPTEAERCQVQSCINDVGLAEDISRLSGGLDANVGPDGDVLSGGQKQRLVLARALYHGAELFALDEAISGLETDGKHSILRLIRRLSENGHIIILISHDVVADAYATKVLKL